MPFFLVLVSLYSLSSGNGSSLELGRKPLLTESEQQAYQSRKPLHKDQQELMERIRDGQGIVWSMVKVGSTNFVDGTGMTPLMFAALFGELEKVEQLLGLGDSISINRQNDEGRTALMLAAMGGHTEILAGLSGYHTLIDYSIKDNRGLTALGLAVMCNRRSAAKFLLQKSPLDTSAFETAVENRSPAMLQLLLKGRKKLSREQQKEIDLAKLLYTVDDKIKKMRVRLGNLYGKDYKRAMRVRRRLEKMQHMLICSGAKRAQQERSGVGLFVHTSSSPSPSPSPPTSPLSRSSQSSLSTSPPSSPSPSPPLSYSPDEESSLFAGCIIRDDSSQPHLSLSRVRSHSLPLDTGASHVELFISQRKDSEEEKKSDC